MQLGDIKNIARHLLDEAKGNNGLFSDDNLTAWANMAERDIAAKSGCIEIIESAQTIVGSRLVLTSGDRVNDVELNGVSLGGSEVILKDVEDDYLKYLNDVIHDYTRYSIEVPYPRWLPLRITPHHLGHINLRDSTLPQYWFQWGNYVVLEPTPSDVYDLNLYISISPTQQMSDDEDEPMIPHQYHEAIIPYVVMCGKMRQHYYQDAALKYEEYIIKLQYLIDKYKRRAALRMSDIRLPDLSNIGKKK